MEDWELESIKDDAKSWKKFINEVVEQDDKKHRLCEIDEIVVTCPWCDGTGTDGHDRSYPPNPYVCQICDGSGKVKVKSYGERKEELGG